AAGCWSTMRAPKRTRPRSTGRKSNNDPAAPAHGGVTKLHIARAAAAHPHAEMLSNKADSAGTVLAPSRRPAPGRTPVLRRRLRDEQPPQKTEPDVSETLP